ncbi:ABC-2 type transport system ATP-binding protein [Lentibacillus persicus]|uniref:ABC-2 type transport system ATP-binding protein n=1 Tax=Lentibacillus persicus TaxID=640948 RepID=A0A1I1XBJ2_9BACI|nr:ATP-binding cassette domain-containing protein [Lentibacillus persicus]SFE03073.1 ABC-2 type transport system ATP-binding protein [Lentibacillus persicus]
MKEDFEAYIKHTSLIPNHPFLYDYLTVRESIDLVADIAERADIKENAMNLMKNLELERYEAELVKNLSLGTKQKVSFITSVMNEPKLVLIDEPFVNFDKHSLSVILAFIRDYINDTKATVIFSTHLQYNQIKELVSHNIHIIGSKQIESVEAVKANDYL